MNGERANADQLRRVERAPERIEQQPGPQAAALCLPMNGEAGKHDERNRMARHAFDDALGGVRMANLASNNRIETDNLTVAQGNVGLRGIRLLSLQRMSKP